MTILIAGLALLLPGLCWWIWFGRRDDDPVEMLAKIIGISVSINALVAQLFFVVKQRITLAVLLVFLLVWLGLSLWGIFKRHDIKASWAWLGVALVFVELIAWRLYQAVELVLPPWVDSLHHVLIVRKIIETGGLPIDLSPYLPVPFYYHFAFHSFTAEFSVLSQLSPDQAVLILGQMLNAAIGLSVYTLGRALFKDWRPAVLAGLLTAFFTQMPAYYLTWGRYTLLTGLVIMPLAMAVAIKVLHEGRERWDWLAITLFTAGTLLAHYFAAILLALFFIVLGAAYLFVGWRARKLDWKPLIMLVLSAVTGLALAGPWMLRVIQFSVVSSKIYVNLPENIGGFFNNTGQWEYIWYLVGPKRGHVLLFLGLPSLILAFWKPKLRVFAWWSLILVVQSLPWGLEVGSFREDHFAIVMFLPLALLTAGLSVAVGDLISRFAKRQWLGYVFLLLITSSAMIWGIKDTGNIINANTILATQADIQALDWIEKHTIEEARFFINTAEWGYEVSRGVDGGAWILPLTGRWTLAPTVFYGFGEDRAWANQISAWGKQAQGLTGCTDDFWQLVLDAKLTHIYLREGVGSLQAEALIGCEGVEVVYAQEGVTIFTTSVDAIP